MHCGKMTVIFTYQKILSQILNKPIEWFPAQNGQKCLATLIIAVVVPRSGPILLNNAMFQPALAFNQSQSEQMKTSDQLGVGGRCQLGQIVTNKFPYYFMSKNLNYIKSSASFSSPLYAPNSMAN